MRFACDHCRKKFRTEGAMNMHFADKHNKAFVQRASAPQPRKGLLGVFLASLLGALVAVLMSGGAFVVVSKAPGLHESVPVVWKAVQRVVAKY